MDKALNESKLTYFRFSHGNMAVKITQIIMFLPITIVIQVISYFIIWLANARTTAASRQYVIIIVVGEISVGVTALVQRIIRTSNGNGCRDKSTVTNGEGELNVNARSQATVHEYSPLQNPWHNGGGESQVEAAGGKHSFCLQAAKSGWFAPTRMQDDSIS